MKRLILTTLLAAVSCVWTPSLEAQKIHGKIDAGPTYVHLDVLQDGDTLNDMDMYGMKVTSTFIVWLGLCLKPNVMVAWNDGLLFNYGCGIGWLVPLFDMKVTITPVVGGSYGYLRTETQFPTLVPVPLKEQFNSKTVYVAVDASWTPHPKWTLGFQIQRAWANSRTTITIPSVMTIKTKGESTGWDIGGSIDYWMTSQWSIQAAAGYSASRAQEKNGMRGYGGRVGLGYFF